MERSQQASMGSDAELLARLRSNDDAAYEELVQRYGARMLAAARRILGNDEDAADALQDALLSAFKALASFDGASGLGTWIHRIAINAALMKLRSGRRRREESIDPLLPAYTEFGHRIESPRAAPDTAAAPAVQAEMAALVRRAIDRLPENHRIALVLRDIEQFENEELARRLGITVNAAKIRVHRARQALREMLAPFVSEEDA
jgi:RNA polymerase sigma-70 factor (ECF subfamily)